MSDVRLKITRNDIAKMLNTTDQRIIAQFEQLFKQASQTTPDNVAALQSAVGLLLPSPSIQPNRLDLQEDVSAPTNVNGMVLIYNATTRKWVGATLTAGANVSITNSPGGITIDVSTPASITSNLTNTNPTYLISTNQALANGAGAAVGTLTNAPSVGNPSKWISINDNGTIRKIPTWL